MSTPRPEDLEPDWLTETLRNSAAIAAYTRVASARLETIGQGAGMMSALGRLHLQYEGGAPGPASLVVKSPAVNETNRAVAASFQIYEREARFFKELAPRCLARTPKIHCCEIDEEQNFILLMEDLLDYRLGDQIAGAGLEETELCLEQLARLHASFWNAVQDLAWVPLIEGSTHANNYLLGAEHGWPQTEEVFGHVIPKSISDTMGRFRAALPRLQQALATPPLTLIHGDFRLENLFFGVGDDQAPLVIIDWQGPLLARGIDDVAFFLAQNTQTEVRRAHERRLVRRYVERLAELGIEGCDFEPFWQDYRLAVLYNWGYVILVSGTLDSSTPHARAWMTEMVRRNAAAIEDLDALEFL